MSFAKGSRQALLSRLSENKIIWAQKTWRNYMEGVIQPNAIIVEVDNEEQVRQTILAVKQQNEAHPHHKITIRAAAGWNNRKSPQCGCFCFWPHAQEARYNESFSFSEGASADVIIRFSKTFQSIKKLGKTHAATQQYPDNPIKNLPSTLVQVSAGVQIATLADHLREAKLSLSTVSMIAWVSAVGLAATGGHGTGRDEPSFSGLVHSIRVCDMDGEIREICSDHKDFASLCGAHAGMMGVVLSIQLKAVKAFNLAESVHNFRNAKTLTPFLSQFLRENQYFTLMRIPTYPCPGIDEKSRDKWHVRLWNYTSQPRTSKRRAPYTADACSLTQELSVRVGDSVQQYLLDSGLQHLLPAYLLLTAAVITGTRGTDTRIDYENHITHYQAGFPKAMRDVSYLIPVKDRKAGKLLAKICKKIDELLLEAGKRSEYPLTYAVYVRYLKGTNGGLSSTATSSEEERILAIDMVTHPAAPGITRFEAAFLAFLKQLDIQPAYHPGKDFPDGITSYADFLKPEALEDYQRAITDWYGGEDTLARSPFLSPYLKDMLFATSTSSPKLHRTKAAEPAPVPHHSTTECCQFLEKLIREVEKIALPDESLKEVKAHFVHECRDKIQELNPLETSSSL